VTPDAIAALRSSAVKLHGVINASPDSLADFSVALTTDAALERAEMLLDQGCVGIDIGGAGSTQFADRVDVDEEWSRLDGKIQALAGLDIELSVDTWKPEIMRRALDAGANFMNAADGLQNPEMVALAADRGVPVVVPFISGVDPKALAFVEGDPLDTIMPWFEATLERIISAGVSESQVIIDPGTGFGPADWAWEDRRRYQEAVYSDIDRLRVFGMPIYMALPWKFDGGRLELLDILLKVGFDYGRTHRPDFVLARRAELEASGEL
jgi:dihydropteroate synthase